MNKPLLLLIILLLANVARVNAQDTLAISFEEFLSRAVENIGQLKVADTDIRLAENRTQQAKDQRFLPSLGFRSEHALVPGVDSDFNEDAAYLDPSATNDWGDIGLYTRLRIDAVQPVFTWGAINKAINAAQVAEKVVQKQYEATFAEIELVLYDLYFSYILALEIERLLRDAEDTMDEIEEAMDKQEEENPEELDESDVFKFQVFKAQFGIQRAEVAQNLLFVEETWKYALRNENGDVFEPEIRFLDAVPANISEVGFYQASASMNRPELQALDFGKEALETYISALRAQNLPGVFLGIRTTLASTPNRPNPSNPYIPTPENTYNTAVGFTIRQNLNFFQAKTSLERSRLETRRLDFLKISAMDGIMIEVNQAYREASIAKAKFESTDEALGIAKNWVRIEQYDYDFGFGDSEDYLDAVRQELELRLAEKQSIFEFNSKLAKLNKTSGLPLQYTAEQN